LSFVGDLDSVVEVWKGSVDALGLTLGHRAGGAPTRAKPADAKAGKKKSSGKVDSSAAQARKRVEVRCSDDVGNYVCGFLYYASLLEAKKGGKGTEVVFLHVPMMEGHEELKVGAKVVEEGVRALVSEWSARVGKA
jgi:pyroglutamyl-peptidase